MYTECSFVPRVTIVMDELGFKEKHIYEKDFETYNKIKDLIWSGAKINYGDINKTSETNLNLMYLDVNWSYKNLLKAMETFARDKRFSNKCLVPVFISKRGGFYPKIGLNYENELSVLMNHFGYNIEQLKIADLLPYETVKDSVNCASGTDWHYNRGRGAGYVWKIYLVTKI